MPPAVTKKLPDEPQRIAEKPNDIRFPVPSDPSYNSDEIIMPNLIGMNSEDAISKLNILRITYSGNYNGNSPNNVYVVSGQSLESGTAIKPIQFKGDVSRPDARLEFIPGDSPVEGLVGVIE